MSDLNHCPCVNLNCPNHGNCQDCTSRHLKKGTLSYCSFYSLLPRLEAAVSADPQSETARLVSEYIVSHTDPYARLMDQHGLSFQRQQELLVEKSTQSAY